MLWIGKLVNQVFCQHQLILHQVLLIVKEILLINISGADKPGVTSAITHILAQYQANILDIGQAVIHDHLTLGLLVEIPEEFEASPVLKEVLFKAHELNLQILPPFLSDENRDLKL